MKRSVELLSTAMRTIDLETIFVNYVQFGINFHSFKLTLSLDTEVLFDRQKTLSQILESTIAFVKFRHKVFLKFCLSYFKTISHQ